MRMMKYHFDPEIIIIEESDNDVDVEFRIRLLKETPYLGKLKCVKRKFEDNDIYTDALFYAYIKNEYRVIVRKDYYVEFVLELMKQQLLISVEWANA
jgi:hypothetical protein